MHFVFVMPNKRIRFFSVCQLFDFLRYLVPNAFVADHAHQQVQLFAVRLSRVAALRRYYSFCSETFSTDGAVSKLLRVLRDFESNATTADDAHPEGVQPSCLRPVHPHRVTTLRHCYFVFYSQMVATVVPSTLFPAGGSGSKGHRLIIYGLQQNGIKCCEIDLHWLQYCFNFVRLLAANQTSHGQCPDHGGKAWSEPHP